MDIPIAVQNQSEVLKKDNRISEYRHGTGSELFKRLGFGMS